MADKKNKPPFYLIDTQSQFYKPLGVRIAICASVIVWAIIETWHRDPFWSVISIACAVYCVYVLYWSYKPPEEPAPRPPDPEDEEEDSEVQSEAPPVAAKEPDETPRA